LTLTATLTVILLLSPVTVWPQVVINEIQSSNTSTLADEDGDFEDWIELYNASDRAIELTGFGLSDNYNNPFKWVFPAVTMQPCWRSRWMIASMERAWGHCCWNDWHCSRSAMGS
jgi:hypothetical protein